MQNYLICRCESKHNCTLVYERLNSSSTIWIVWLLIEGNVKQSMIMYDYFWLKQGPALQMLWKFVFEVSVRKPIQDVVRH